MGEPHAMAPKRRIKLMRQSLNDLNVFDCVFGLVQKIVDECLVIVRKEVKKDDVFEFFWPLKLLVPFLDSGGSCLHLFSLL